MNYWVTAFEKAEIWIREKLSRLFVTAKQALITIFFTLLPIGLVYLAQTTGLLSKPILISNTVANVVSACVSFLAAYFSYIPESVARGNSRFRHLVNVAAILFGSLVLIVISEKGDQIGDAVYALSAIVSIWTIWVILETKYFDAHRFINSDLAETRRSAQRGMESKSLLGGAE